MAYRITYGDNYGDGSVGLTSTKSTAPKQNTTVYAGENSFSDSFGIGINAKQQTATTVEKTVPLKEKAAVESIYSTYNYSNNESKLISQKDQMLEQQKKIDSEQDQTIQALISGQSSVDEAQNKEIEDIKASMGNLQSGITEITFDAGTY